MARNSNTVLGIENRASSPEAGVAPCFRITSLFDTSKSTEVLFVGPYDTKLYRRSLVKRLCLIAGIPSRGRSISQSAQLSDFRRHLRVIPDMGSAFLELPVELDRWLTFVVDIAAPAYSDDSSGIGSDPIDRIVVTFRRDFRDGVRFDPDFDSSLAGVKLGQGDLQTVV